VATAIESLMSIAAREVKSRVRPGPRDAGLRRARVCYDHLAGETAVRALQRMRERGFLSGNDECMALTGSGEKWCATVGIDLLALRGQRRRLLRACLDWSERRTHLAGSLCAALLDRMLALRYARRLRESRVVTLSPRGESFVETLDPAR
jgi:hypothetical protein